MNFMFSWQKMGRWVVFDERAFWVLMHEVTCVFAMVEAVFRLCVCVCVRVIDHFRRFPRCFRFLSPAVYFLKGKSWLSSQHPQARPSQKTGRASELVWLKKNIIYNMISCHTFNKLESNIKLPHLLFYSPIFSRHFVVGLRFFVASKTRLLRQRCDVWANPKTRMAKTWVSLIRSFPTLLECPWKLVPS